MPTTTVALTGDTVTPPQLDALAWRDRWQDLLRASAPAPTAGVDDVPGIAALLPSVTTAQHTTSGGWAEGRTFTLTVGLGGLRASCTDQARSDRALDAHDDRRRRRVDLRASLFLAGDTAALDALDRSGDGVITHWSGKSRARMVETFANLDYAPMTVHEDRVGAMVTLTYPGEWQSLAPDGATAKRHLDAFRKRFLRAYGDGWCGLWKLEFQRRGAPHFHLFLPVPARSPDRSRTFEAWLSSTWADCVGATGDERARHEAAGTNVDFGAAAKCSDPKRLAVYFLKHGSKTLDDKEYQHIVPPEWREPGKGPGRFWGYWKLDRGDVPVTVTADDFFAARRVLRKVLRAHDVTTARARARQTGTYVAPPRRRTLGHAGAMVGGFVLSNDSLAFARDLARWLESRSRT